jgi:hypothetical protein
MSDGQACRQRPTDRNAECPDCGGHLFVERFPGDADWICHSCHVTWDSGDEVAPGSTQYRDAEQLRRWYIDQGMTGTEIADLCNVLPSTIYHWLDRHDIETRERGGER